METSDGLPVAFRDLPASHFPFTIEWVNHLTRKVILSSRIEGPGAIRVPGKAELGSVPVGVRIIPPDGDPYYCGPDGANE